MNRQPGIELLRGLLMLMIVLVHMTGNGVLNPEAPLAYTEPNWIWANVIDAICYPAVNAFILISGFFGIRLSLEKVLKLEIPVFIYSVVLFLAFGCFSLGGALSAFFPILSKEYWFLTSYFLLLLVSPFINAFVDCKKDRELKILVALAFILFVGVPSFTPFRLADTRGMDVFNFCVLYIIGRSFAVLKFNISKSKALWLYIGSTIIVFSLTVLFAYKWGINRGWQSRFYAYNNIFVYVQAIGLFFFFKHIQISEKIGKAINWIAPSFFYVYIIHSSPSIVENLYVWISSANYYYSNMFMLHTIVWALIVFSFCVLIDIIIRRYLLKAFIKKGIYVIQSGYNYMIKKLK